MAYVPDGLSKEQWAAMQKKVRAAKKDLGKNGVKGTIAANLHCSSRLLNIGDWSSGL